MSNTDKYIVHMTPRDINFIRNPPPPHALQINDHPLDQSQTVKLLEVHIQHDLKRDTHINSVLQ